MQRRLLSICCILFCILTGCGEHYHWTKSHPSYSMPPQSGIAITGLDEAFVLTRSKWFSKKLEISPESVQVELTGFIRKSFVDEMRRAYPTIETIRDSAIKAFPEESEKLDSRIFIKGHFPEQGVWVKDEKGNIPPCILIIHEFIVGTDLKRELFYDYALIHNESAEHVKTKNVSAIVAYTLWDNERQRPLFSAVDEINRPVASVSRNDLESLARDAAKKIRINLYEGAGK